MSDIPTYHRGPRNYGTGFDMMDRIEALEAECWRMKEDRDRAIGWRDSDKARAEKAEAEIARLRALLKEARDDLQTYVENDWPIQTRETYPSVMRKYERDMELCHRIDAALTGENSND